MGSFALNEVPRSDGNLVHIFNDLVDGAAVACLPPFGNASVARARTARHPPPRRPVRRTSRVMSSHAASAEVSDRTQSHAGQASR